MINGMRCKAFATSIGIVSLHVGLSLRQC